MRPFFVSLWLCVLFSVKPVVAGTSTQSMMPACRKRDRKQAAHDSLSNRQRHKIPMRDENPCEHEASDKGHRQQNRIRNMKCRKHRRAYPGRSIGLSENREQPIREKRLQSKLLKQTPGEVSA